MLSFIANAVIAGAIFNNIHHSFKNKTKEWKLFYKHYFMVMATLLVIDSTFSFALYRIPYYQLFKLMLLGWISVPMSTGPHFVYNVYLKNIYKLFSGDIDAVMDNIHGYADKIKAKYYEMVNSAKKGEISIGFNKGGSKLELPKNTEGDSSEAEMSSVDLHEERQEDKED